MGTISVFPARKTFRIWKGATFHYRFQYLIGGPTSSTPQDLTGYTGTLTIKSLDGLTTYLTLTSGSDITFNGISGLIDIIIPAATTAGLTWTQGKYQFLVTDPNTNESPAILTGQFVVSGL